MVSVVYLLGSGNGAGGRNLSGLKKKNIFEYYFTRKVVLKLLYNVSVPPILILEGSKGYNTFWPYWRPVIQKIS